MLTRRAAERPPVFVFLAAVGGPTSEFRVSARLPPFLRIPRLLKIGRIGRRQERSSLLVRCSGSVFQLGGVGEISSGSRYVRKSLERRVPRKYFRYLRLPIPLRSLHQRGHACMPAERHVVMRTPVDPWPQHHEFPPLGGRRGEYLLAEFQCFIGLKPVLAFYVLWTQAPMS